MMMGIKRVSHPATVIDSECVLRCLSVPPNEMPENFY